METATLRIVHTVSSLDGGGMEHFVLRLCEAQRVGGHESSILSVKGGPLHALAQSRGLPVGVLNGETKGRRIAHALASYLALRPHIVHCHNPTALQYSVLSKAVSSPRLVFTDHAQTKGIIRMPHPLEWRLVNATVAVSAETARNSRNDIGYPGVPDVIHNGIDPKPALRTRAEVRAELGLGSEVVGINVASFFPVKAQDVLVRALSELKGKGVRTTMLCVGDGEERAKVEALAAEVGLSASNVRFLGFRNDIADLLGASDFFVLPSRSEGLPMSVLEAMSHRLPVVLTLVGGNAELVTDGAHGFLVPADNVTALAAAMERVVADRDLRQRLGTAGQARVRDEFSFASMAAGYEAIYQRVMSKGRFESAQ